MQNNGTTVSIVQTAAAPEKRPCLCIQCWEPITGDGVTVPAVEPFQASGDYIHFRAAYHAECLPAVHRSMALAATEQARQA